MNIVVDSNIVFSAMLNTKSNIGQLLTDGSTYFSYYSVSLLKTEIHNHKKRLCKIAGFTEQEFEEVFYLITNKIKFIDEILISDKDFSNATKLIATIDTDDILFVALANHLHTNLWTGDKKLITGLKAKGYTKILTTEMLYQLYLDKKTKQQFGNK